MDVSIIIVNYNTKALTQGCINSIFEKTEDVSIEVILVDNNSTDGSVELFSADSRIIFIPLSENVGFGKANNAGLKKAKGKYIFFLNSDTYLLNNAIKEFYDFAEKRQKDSVGGIGCRLLKSDMSYCHSYAPFPSFWGELWKPIILPLSLMLGKPYKYLDKPEHNEAVFKVGYVTGADLFVRKDVIDKYGAFDPDFFMYYEESEMQHRWTKSGFGSMIITSPKIVHLEGASYGEKHVAERNVKKELQVMRSILLYMKKTLNIPMYVLFRLLFFIVKLPFLVLSRLAFREKMLYVKLVCGHI